ncbi:hypothetical protein HII31_06487 [Pseudocercospora fuligena]|uniref:F-box domain-containing protein n=1 Tax=Pseudocercospora fuligena TaxID=685502 RepID=A0A8H6RJC2_9PEZI|nr:hypothetical protein HII31_06487 [Pseudocercospora fuligena]
MAPSLLQKLRTKFAIKRATTTTSPTSPSPSLPPSPTNNAPEVTTAATKVFAITELLEHILLNLDTSSLLLCLRVSHLFNTTILSSPILKAVLFLLPSLPSTSSPWPGYIKRNTLLEERNVPWDKALGATWTSPRSGKTYRIKIRHYYPEVRTYGFSVTIGTYRNSLGVRRPPPPLARVEEMEQEPPSKYMIELMKVPKKRTWYGRKKRERYGWPKLPGAYEKMGFFFPGREIEVLGERRRGGRFSVGFRGEERLGDVLVKMEGYWRG